MTEREILLQGKNCFFLQHFIFHLHQAESERAVKEKGSFCCFPLNVKRSLMRAQGGCSVARGAGAILRVKPRSSKDVKQMHRARRALGLGALNPQRCTSRWFNPLHSPSLRPFRVDESSNIGKKKKKSLRSGRITSPSNASLHYRSRHQGLNSRFFSTFKWAISVFADSRVGNIYTNTYFSPCGSQTSPILGDGKDSQKYQYHSVKQCHPGSLLLKVLQNGS